MSTATSSSKQEFSYPLQLPVLGIMGSGDSREQIVLIEGHDEGRQFGHGVNDSKQRRYILMLEAVDSVSEFDSSLIL